MVRNDWLGRFMAERDAADAKWRDQQQQQRRRGMIPLCILWAFLLIQPTATALILRWLRG